MKKSVLVLAVIAASCSIAAANVLRPGFETPG
jgi:hypothetical protein